MYRGHEPAAFSRETIEEDDMHNPLVFWMVELHQSDLLEKTKKDHLSEAVKTASPSLRMHLFERAGGVLISAGLMLQSRQKPAVCPNPKAHRPGC